MREIVTISKIDFEGWQLNLMISYIKQTHATQRE